MAGFFIAMAMVDLVQSDWFGIILDLFFVALFVYLSQEREQEREQEQE
jgi:hypothetical protein